MLSVLIGAVINIVLDPVFIFVFGMGVSGAALATILSQAVSAAWVLRFLFSAKSGIRIRLSLIHICDIRPHLLRFPTGTASLFQILFQAAAGRYLQ